MTDAGGRFLSRHPWIPFALVFLLAAGAYLGTLSHKLVWDDLGLIRYIDRTVDEKGPVALVTSRFTSGADKEPWEGYYRPIPMTSLWLDSRYAAIVPNLYHVTNVLLHAVVSVLVLWFFILISPSRAGAFVGALIFAVHPVHTESVAFVSGRTDILAAGFVVASAALWVQARRSAVPSTGHLVFWSHASFFLACLSKETSFALPVILLIWDLVERPNPQGSQWGWWGRNRPWITGWLVVIALQVPARLAVFGPTLGLAAPLESLAGQGGGVSPYGSAVLVWLTYMKLLVFPWPLKVFYTASVLAWTVWLLFAAVLFCLLIGYTAGRDKRRIGALAGTWFVLFLLPVAGIAHRGGAILAERFLYIPSVLFCLAAGLALAQALSSARWRRGAQAALVALLSVMIAGVWIQAGVWKNELTLFGEMTRVSPMADIGFYNLGNALSERGRYQESLDPYRRACLLNPGSLNAWFNMGNSYWHLGLLDEAIKAYGRALKINPGFVSAHLNLGVVLLKSGKPAKAGESFKRAVQLDPKNEKAHLGLMISFQRTGDKSSAMSELTVLRRLRPDVAGPDRDLPSGNSPEPAE